MPTRIISSPFLFAYCSPQWRLLSAFEAHTDSVTTLAALRLPKSGDMLIASASADCTVKVWRRAAPSSPAVSPAWILVQTLSFKPRPMEALAMSLAPLGDAAREVPLLVTAGTDHLVHVHVWDSSASNMSPNLGGQFSRVLALQGHADWVRALAFCRCDNGDVLLASSAQGT